MAWRKNNGGGDLDLARRAAAGEAVAWQRLVDRFGGRIYNVARRFGRTPAEAEDLTQEIFLKLYRNLHRYRGDVPLAAWTLRLSKNLCIEQYRRSRLERAQAHVPAEELVELASGDDPRADAQRRLRLEAVHRAMAEMNQDLALAVLLRDLQGFSYEEAAAFLGVPMGTLKSRLVRARRELAQRVARLVEPSPPPLNGTGGAELAEAGSC